MFSFKGKGLKHQMEENRNHSNPTISINVKSWFPKWAVGWGEHLKGKTAF